MKILGSGISGTVHERFSFLPSPGVYIGIDQANSLLEEEKLLFQFLEEEGSWFM